MACAIYGPVGLSLNKTAATEIGVQVKVDPGMHGLGAAAEEAVKLAIDVAADAHLRLEGFWTHFADADQDPAFTREQLQVFLDARSGLIRAGVTNFLSHAANSAGLLRFPEARLDLVRAGLIIYGVRPVRSWIDLPGLRPALRWQTIVTNVVTLPIGESVGYGRKFIAREPAMRATIAVAYADALHPRASDGGRAIVRGLAVAIAGAVSIDQAALHVAHVPYLTVC